MKKHQQWLDNRKYQHHLNCLQQIRIRRCVKASSRPRKSALKTHIRLRHQDSYDLARQTITNSQLNHQGDITNGDEQQITLKADEHHKYKPSTQQRNLLNPSQITLKERNLIWQNFLIGKRIIQTPPVICKRRLDDQFIKHQQRLHSHKKSVKRSSFRSKKLKQFNQKLIKIDDGLRIQSNMKCNALSINIKQINFHKIKPNIKDLRVCLNYITQGKKGHRQISQIIPYSIFTNYQFYFRITSKQILNKVSIYVTIQELKGLQCLNIGSFQINLQDSTEVKDVDLLKVGKLVGKVHALIKILKREQFLRKSAQFIK